MIEIAGKVVVPTAGVPVQLAQQPAVLAVLNNKIALARVQGVRLQAIPSNMGLVYVGNAAMVKATFEGVGYILGVPVATVTPPSLDLSFDTTAAGVDLQEIYLDTANNGEGVLVILQIT